MCRGAPAGRDDHRRRQRDSEIRDRSPAAERDEPATGTLHEAQIRPSGVRPSGVWHQRGSSGTRHRPPSGPACVGQHRGATIRGVWHLAVPPGGTSGATAAVLGTTAGPVVTGTTRRPAGRVSGGTAWSPSECLAPHGVASEASGTAVSPIGGVWHHRGGTTALPGTTRHPAWGTVRVSQFHVERPRGPRPTRPVRWAQLPYRCEVPVHGALAPSYACRWTLRARCP